MIINERLKRLRSLMKDRGITAYIAVSYTHLLRLSLDSLKEDVEKILAILHYPPFNPDLSSNEFIDIMKEYNVDILSLIHI